MLRLFTRVLLDMYARGARGVASQAAGRAFGSLAGSGIRITAVAEEKCRGETSGKGEEGESSFYVRGGQPPAECTVSRRLPYAGSRG